MVEGHSNSQDVQVKRLEKDQDRVELSEGLLCKFIEKGEGLSEEDRGQDFAQPGREGKHDVLVAGNVGKSNVILQYAEEALETMPVMPRPQIENNSKNDAKTDTKVPTTPMLKEQDIKALTELKDTERKLKKEIQFLRATQDKLDDSILKREKVSKENHGLLPPTVISKGGMVHENKRQPIASPVMAWHTRCGWPFGASAFSFGLDVTMVSCQKCLLLAQSDEERCGKGGG